MNQRKKLPVLAQKAVMKNKLLNKKVPTILGFFLLICGIGGGILLVNKKQLLKLKDKPVPAPKDVRISNVQDNRLTISWITTETSDALVEYGIAPSMENTAIDDRDQRSGEIGKYKIHYVTLKDLEPEKTYYFKINSKQHSVITGPFLKANRETKIVSGKILNPDKTPANKAIVYFSSENMAFLSVLTDKNGRWTIFLNQARTKDLTENALFDVGATVLKIEAQDGEKKVKAVILTKNAFPSIPDLVLGHEPYDFRERIPVQMSVEEVIITIDNPAEEGEQINTSQPEFLGQGPPDKSLTITVESSEPYSASVTTDENGNWSFVPPFALSPGEHTVSVSYTDEDGEEKTISRNFVVLAAGESELPAITATPSASLEPSPSPNPTPQPSPSPSPSPSPAPRVSIPSTEEEMPATGTPLPTILISLAGIAMIVFALFPALF